MPERQSWLLPHIRAKIPRHLRALLAKVEEMDHGELTELWELIQKLEQDAKSEGQRDGARHPWRHGRF